MINNDTNINPTLTLTNAGGAYTIEVDTLNLALIKTATLAEAVLRDRAADACGYSRNWLGLHDEDVFRGWTRLEVLIAWVESGNFA